MSYNPNNTAASLLAPSSSKFGNFLSMVNVSGFAPPSAPTTQPPGGSLSSRVSRAPTSQPPALPAASAPASTNAFASTFSVLPAPASASAQFSAAPSAPAVSFAPAAPPPSAPADSFGSAPPPPPCRDVEMTEAPPLPEPTPVYSVVLPSSDSSNFQGPGPGRRVVSLTVDTWIPDGEAGDRILADLGRRWYGGVPSLLVLNDPMEC